MKKYSFIKLILELVIIFLGIFIDIDGETAPEIAARLQRLRNPGGIGFHIPVRHDVDSRIILQIRDGILNCPPGVYCA